MTTAVAKRGPGRPRKNPPAAQAQAQVPQVVAKYDAAGTGKRMAGFNPPSTGPNKAIVGLQKIRDRAQDVTRNDWTGESGTQKWTTTLIGVGIIPRFKRVKGARKQVVLDLWNDFVAQCDADGVNTFYGLQTLAVRTWLVPGEVFIRKRPRRADDGLAVPLQVQLIEPEFVPLLDADTYVGMPAGNRIRQGIELDRRGQRVAYWMYREHPGDGMQIGSLDPSKLLRIPASEVKHLFVPTRPGQLRGVSALAPILPKLRDIGNYQDAVLLRQQIANLFVAFLTRKDGAEDENDPLTGKSIAGTFNDPLAPLSPGLIQELEDGQGVTWSNPPEAGTTYSDYLRTELLGVAAANGLPYEVFSGDIKDISDRTLRVIINEFRRFAEQRQWQVIIPMMCQPVMDWFAAAGVLAGKIALSEIEDVRRVEWAPHGWAYIHPVQDPQGKKLEVESGFRSRSSVIAERGDDPETVDQERADDMQREKDLELWVDPNPLPADDQGADPEDDDKPEPTALAQSLTRRAEAETRLIDAQAQRASAPPQPQQMTLFEQEQIALARTVVALLEPTNAQ